MKKRYIEHPNYKGEDRRSIMAGSLPELGNSFKSWLPIWIPVAGGRVLFSSNKGTYRKNRNFRARSRDS
jgi:hypothetical protein